jgi:hypothetical protein
MELVRALLSLLILALTLSTSGISSAAIATITGDGCCADAEEDAHDQDHPDGEQDKCPPLCHTCACSPTFAVPKHTTTVELVCVLERGPTFDVSSQPPASPPRPGVFHPPRLRA